MESRGERFLDCLTTGKKWLVRGFGAFTSDVGERFQGGGRLSCQSCFSSPCTRHIKSIDLMPVSCNPLSTEYTPSKSITQLMKFTQKKCNIRLPSTKSANALITPLLHQPKKTALQ